MENILLNLKNDINNFIIRKTDDISNNNKTFKLLNELPLVKELKNENENLKKTIINLKAELANLKNNDDEISKNKKRNIKLIINDNKNVKINNLCETKDVDYLDFNSFAYNCENINYEDKSIDSSSDDSYSDDDSGEEGGGESENEIEKNKDYINSLLMKKNIIFDEFN